MGACCKILISLGLLIGSAAGSVYAGAPAPRGWEQIKTERSDTKAVVRAAEVEIRSARGLITVNASHPVQIKVFTILGRLVNAETVPAGRSQLLLPVHGVYIVKVGDVTCKVAV